MQIELKTRREYLERMQEERKIKPSESSAGNPFVFVRKANGHGLRLCVNYGKIKTVTILNSHPLTVIQELQNKVQGGVALMKLDMKNNYNLIRMKKGDQ